MKGSSLAILLAPKKGEEGSGEDGDGSGDDSYESKAEDYRELAEQAFPDEEWTPERVSALKQFVMLCMEK